MPSNLNLIILMLISAVPLLLWAMGLFGSVLSGEHARLMSRLSNGAAGLSFICAALNGLLKYPFLACESLIGSIATGFLGTRNPLQRREKCHLTDYHELFSMTPH
ncbi:MAG: hypothetical protein ACYCY1_12005 [Sulfuriferula sp.]